MPINKLVPKVPDPYISKNEQNQFWPARFGHLDYIVDQINSGGAIPEGFSQIYTELITIPGTVYAGGGPLFYDFPADGLSQQLISQGKYIIPIGFTVAVFIETVGSLIPLGFTSMSFYTWDANFSNGTEITNKWSILGAGVDNSVNYIYVPAIVEGGGIITFPSLPVDQTGTKFRLQRDPGGGGFNGTATDCLKIAFTFQAIDINWLFKLTN